MNKMSFTYEEKGQLLLLIAEFEVLFALDNSELGRTFVVTHSIDTEDHYPIKQYPRHVPFFLGAKGSQLVEEMLKQRAIKFSTRPWASPIVLVSNRDGSTCFCVDYRKLNTVTSMDVHPLTQIDDSLDLPSETKFFSMLDLASGYWQVAMSPESQEKTTFTTHFGVCEFTVMPFSLCNTLGPSSA